MGFPTKNDHFGVPPFKETPINQSLKKILFSQYPFPAKTDGIFVEHDEQKIGITLKQVVCGVLLLSL